GVFVVLHAPGQQIGGRLGCVATVQKLRNLQPIGKVQLRLVLTYGADELFYMLAERQRPGQVIELILIRLGISCRWLGLGIAKQTYLMAARTQQRARSKRATISLVLPDCGT